LPKGPIHTVVIWPRRGSVIATDMKLIHFPAPPTTALAAFLVAVRLIAADAVPGQAAAQQALGAKTAEPGLTPDVIYVPTPQRVVDKMLEMAQVKPGDVVYDLGCGDGRIVVTAAKKYGVKAVGFDIDPQRVKEAIANVRSNRVEELVTIKQADIFTLDLRPASVVTLYLLPELNVRLMPQLATLKPGSRIISHEFEMEGAKPVQVERLSIPSQEEPVQDRGEHTLYKWVVPWEAASPANKP
jgi:SAM-dependent methyltransferase